MGVPYRFLCDKKIANLFLVNYKYFKSQHSPILTNTHRYSPVLATGCATPHGVRLPDDDCSGVTQVGHQRWNPWRGAAPLTGCGGHPPLTGCATPGTAPRCCAAPRYCTQVQHPGTAPRYCTQVLHPGTPAPRYCTQVLHRGAAPRYCTQVLHPGAGATHPLRGAPPQVLHPGTAPWYCTQVPLHSGAAPRCAPRYPCTQVLHPGTAPLGAATVLRGAPRSDDRRIAARKCVFPGRPGEIKT